MGWANQTINSTVAPPVWVENIKCALVAFDNTGFGFYWNLVMVAQLSKNSFPRMQGVPSLIPSPHDEWAAVAIGFFQD